MRRARYDCSSADLNPIGAISKNDLKRFLVWAAQHLGYSELSRVVAAPPTAELEPLREGVAAQVRLATYLAGSLKVCRIQLLSINGPLRQRNCGVHGATGDLSVSASLMLLQYTLHFPNGG
jgi:hypothetical protein